MAPPHLPYRILSVPSVKMAMPQTDTGGKRKKDYWRLAVQQLQQENTDTQKQNQAIQSVAHSDQSIDLITQLRNGSWDGTLLARDE